MSEETEMSPQRRRAPQGGGRETQPKTLPIPRVPAREAPGPQPATRLYSVFGLARDRAFTGQFNARGTNYQFTYAPASVAVTNGKIELTGRLSVRGAGERALDGVKATLLATQGGVAGSPARRQLQTGTSGTVNVSSPDQKQEEAKAPETEPKPSTQQPEQPRPSADGLPIVEATGPLGFVAAMYFRFPPLEGRALGVPVDLSRVQLNVRLAPENELERDLLWLYSDLVAAVYGEPANAGAASRGLTELNRMLKG